MSRWDAFEEAGHGVVIAVAIGAGIWIVFAAACGALA